MRNYCRIYHTSLDYLTAMPMGRLIAELQDAAADLAEEERQRDKRMKKEEAKAKSRSRSRPKPRRR